MSNLNFRKRRNRRGFFFHLSRHLPTFIVLFVIALVLGGGIFAFSRFVLKKQPGDRPVFATASEATKSNGTPSASAEADSDDPIGQLIDQADRLAKGYDYDKAMELLTETDLRIGDVAEETGWENPNYFSTQFKKKTGKTPVEYRKGQQKNG